MDLSNYLWLTKIINLIMDEKNLNKLRENERIVKLLSSKKLQKDINTILDAEEPIVALENMIQNN